MTPARCREHAQFCIELAAKETQADRREQLIDMAATWLRVGNLSHAEFDSIREEAFGSRDPGRAMAPSDPGHGFDKKPPAPSVPRPPVRARKHPDTGGTRH
jgi:hypothetical protein